NRIGDFGFTLALFLMFVKFGSFDFARVFEAAGKLPAEISAGWLTAVCLLLMVGAAGKSAQVPLYVWLPDAMEGPTPVSALIHAATMVTAGVYMVARSAALFVKAPVAMEVVALVGLATAVMAATIGLAQRDIKKVFAYSTVSQLGYMFLALGVGAFASGIFHVVTHAFFKALLFLGAGSVIHALGGEQDLAQMGGLRKKIPITFATLLCAAVAIAGVPPFSGFHSKDEILLAAHHHAPWMYWVGVITAAMTAFYVFRAIFLAFFGEPRGHHHPHESPPSMWIPLASLAALSLGGGYFHVSRYLEPIFGPGEAEHPASLVAISVAAGAAGIALAWLMYVARPGLADSIAQSAGVLYRLVFNKYYVDEIYHAVIVRPTIAISRVFLWRIFDAGVIDGMVNGVGTRARGIGGVLRLAQSGQIRSYAAWVVIGAVFLLYTLAISGGGQ
ncbi:MAG: NADH-quinone oxidoreductase subunit L, partial [Bryobacteraceae bacterium]